MHSAMESSALEKFFLNQLDNSERELVLQWLLNPSNNELAKSWMRLHWDMLDQYEVAVQPTEAEIDLIWSNIQTRLKDESIVAPNLESNIQHLPTKKPLRFFYRAAAAAAIISIILLGNFLQKKYSLKSREAMPPAALAYNEDVAPPEGIKAVLVLGDGHKIFIDSAGNGLLAQSGSIKVEKNDKGEVVYSGKAGEEAIFNTLQLPKGSKPLRLRMGDGSVVWLNASSSITYPMAFSGSERKVSLKGEAFFEVAKNENKPFIVQAGNKIVKVLGTSFNVNAYEDEKATKVTLLEGSVEVSNGSRTGKLLPGQQASILSEQLWFHDNVDIDEVMAWKNGEFYFNGADIQTIMRQVEKYYNVEVVYNAYVKYQFVARISREVNVSEFLKILELTNLVHFKIENNQITVMK